jgi:heat shock protein HslJ
VGLVRDFRLVGDLNGDESPEAVFLLYESSGGSGTFFYVTVLERAPEGIVSLGTRGVGDRVQIRSAGLSDGTVVLDVVQTGPEDAACCPGQKVTRRWSVGPDGLTELAPVDDGRLSLDDLSGPEWVLRSFGRDDPAPGEPGITILFESGRLGGGSGCNTYFASAEEGEAPGDITIGAVGMTMMACEEVAMTLEQRYHQALVGVVKYGFIGGRLALTSLTDGEVSTMIFEGREPVSD